MMTPDGPRWTGKIVLDQAVLQKPLHWKRPRMVFVNSMSDLFFEDLPDEAIDRIVAVMAMAPQHTFQVLTKRWDRMAAYLTASDLRYRIDRGTDHIDYVAQWPLPNVWWGASAGHQKAVNQLAPAMARCRPHAAVLWLSVEPLTEVLTLRPLAPFLAHQGAAAIECKHGYDACPICDRGIDWVVGGGESGTGARPCPPAAARQLRDECLAAGVPFHWKQWGEWGPVTYYEEGGYYEADDCLVYRLTEDQLRFRGGRPMLGRVGKKAAGRLLDGRLWNDRPRGFTPALTGV